MGKLVFVRGIPGTGKSTFAKSLGIKHHYEADMYFMNNGKYEFDFDRLFCAHGWCLKSVKTALSEGHDVVVSNTFTKFKEMKQYVSYAVEHGHPMEVHTLTKEYGSVHDVPDDVMIRMRERFVPDDSIKMEIEFEIHQHDITEARKNDSI
jgi:predicted kinase